MVVYARRRGEGRFSAPAPAFASHFSSVATPPPNPPPSRRRATRLPITLEPLRDPFAQAVLDDKLSKPLAGPDLHGWVVRLFQHPD